MFMPEEDRGEAYDAFWRSILGGEVNTARPTRIGKDGRRLRLQASYSPILGFDGSPIGVLKSALDVTAPGAEEGVPLPRLKGPSLRPRPVWPAPVGGGPRVAP
jgi:PAS domain S-box-containing protein